MAAANRVIAALGLAVCLGCARGRAPGLPATPCSFTREPFVHPGLVQELAGPVADTEDTLVALDIVNARDSNKYCFGPYETARLDGEQWVRWTRGKVDDPADPWESFGYTCVGELDSGVIVLYVVEHGTGSGSWHGLLFLKFQRDRALRAHPEAGRLSMDRDRLLLVKLGYFYLGDRWKGRLKVEGAKLYIGRDRGWFADEDGRDAAPPAPAGAGEWAAVLTLQ